MSERSSPILTSTTTQDSRPNLTTFKKILSDVGINLCLNEGPHILRQEQALVVRDLEKTFQKTPEHIDDFLKGLKLLCKKVKHFRKCVLPTKFHKSSEQNDSLTSGIQIQQDSLFRLFLKVSDLQNEIMNVLLEEITAISSEEIQDTSWLRLLLNPLRYLPHIQDPAALTTKLLDNLDIANFPAQLEILDSVPEIIPDSQYGETARQLSRLLDEHDELSGAIIDCLNALDLDLEIRAQVQDKILAKILAGTSFKVFPILLQFILTDCKSQNLVPTLLKVRNALDTMMLSSDNNKEKESFKILIFNRLQAFAVAPKSISEAWLNMISCIKVHSDHRPVDYLILFMLHSTAKFKKRIIEALFRKRVHTGLFKIGMLEKMFDKYLLQQLLKDYFSSIVEIGCSLLRSSTEQSVVEFASALFKMLFNHEHMETLYRREMLESLILLTGASEKNTVSFVLRIISSLLNDNNNLQLHTVLLMRLLEKLDSFELKDVKEVFEILCRLTCGEQADQSQSGLKDEIHMVIRKQLSSSKRTVKHRGIISAIVMAKHIALRSEEQKHITLPQAPVTLAVLPHGPAKEAALLLEQTSMCTGGCPEFTGLYYDQVAMMLTVTTHLDKFFMAWLHETITMQFEKMYVSSTVPNSVNDLRFSMQYLLNDPTEIAVPVGVNIAGLSMENESGRILLLASHFRLLRLIHYRQQAGDITSIDALLGCAVILPEVDDIIDLDTDQARQAADCLFHCVNWFREVVNGFVTQKNKKLRAKVVQRLQHIIDIEKQLRKLMEKIPDHKLPISYFDSVSETSKQATSPVKHDKGKNARKKFKSAPVVDVDETAASTSAATQNRRKKPTTKVAVTELPINFREMDTDLVLLIKYPLKFDADEMEQYSTQTATLNVDQVQFILKDYVTKLSVLTKGKNIGLSHLAMVSPVSMMSDLPNVLPLLDAHFKIIARKIVKLLETADGKYDSPEVRTEEANDLKTCFGLVLDALYNIFSWSGFQHSRNLELLKNLLKSLRSEQSQSLSSANRLILEFINRLAGYNKQCLRLSHAVSLVRTMEALYSVTTPNGDTEKKIVTVARDLLSRRWYDSNGVLDTGKACNANVSVLVKAFLKTASIETISGLVGKLQEQAPSLNAKNDYLEMLASIDKQNVHIFYLELCIVLTNRIKTEIQSLTTSEHLELWHTTAKTMQGLMSIAKTRESKVNLVCFLKKSIGILNIFLSQGIPILEITLKSKPDEVVAILREIQTTTRFLHHLCCYSKFTKDSTLVAHVPKFRLILETLVYKVKATLVANNCSEAFWMGTLRNKDLEGEDILTQSTTTTEITQESEEELPEDDSDEDLVVNNGGLNEGRRSAGSDVYD